MILRDQYSANIPDGLYIVAGTRIRSLPASLKGVQLRWRGVVVDDEYPQRHLESATGVAVNGKRSVTMY